MAGKLYIVPTPVGNLEDMTPRAITVLQQADFVLAEDTRTSGVLMKHFGINTPMRSHHKFNEHDTVERLAEELQGGSVIALVTDAGTPAISDPGFLLVRECRRREIEVETLPGATAFVPALVNSGLPCERFTFEGFLPQKKGRASRMEALAHEPRTTGFGELRNLQTSQHHPQWHSCRSCRPFSSQCSKGRNCAGGGRRASTNSRESGQIRQI